MSESIPGSKLSGSRLLVSVGNLNTELYFESDTTMTFRIIEGAGLVENGYMETVSVKSVLLRPGIYFIQWKEKSGATVSHLENHFSKVLHSVITMPDGQFIHLTGSIQSVEEAKSSPSEQPALSDALTGMKIGLDYGDYKVWLTFTLPFELRVLSTGSISFDQLDEEFKANIYNVYTNGYLLTWKASSGVTMAQVLDLDRRKVYSNISRPDGSFLSVEGNVEVMI